MEVNPMSSEPQLAKNANSKQPSAETRFLRYGLALPRALLGELAKRGIYCQAAVSIEHQHFAQRYVLRGTESGGAEADMARYCAYVDVEGRPLSWLQPLDSLSGNGRHAIVIAPELVRIEMLRVGATYDLAISKHNMLHTAGKQRPSLVSALLFRGREGSLTIKLWEKENASLRGSISPVFYTSAGELRRIPERFDDAVRKITGALASVRCRHAHVAVPPLVSQDVVASGS
jgi:hypothetical protein